MPAAAVPELQGTNGSTNDATSIAVIGLACRFPGDASSPERFWEMLCDGRSAYSESNRYNVDSFHSDVEGKLNTSRPRGAHFLDHDVAAFDANFFTMNENEAIAMDPQARLMLEVGYEAFENAGLPLTKIAGSQTSCFIGTFTSDYRELLLRDPDAAPRYSLSGSGFELISNRLSWFYDLRGASFTLGTACSSSLVALHQGCQSLLSGEAEMSIIGGSNLMLNPDMFLMLSNMQFLAKDGRSKSFDAQGDGYGRGEGCGALVLKRADDAIRDGDPIRAIIRGTGVNQDGHTKGITVPNPEAQADLIRSTYHRAGLDLNNTHYFEAHVRNGLIVGLIRHPNGLLQGTGTKTGDPLELEAISTTLSASNDVIVGSVKPNIGHLEAAAGVAGLIKSIFVLEKALIPPNILFNNPNPSIPFDKWRISIPTRPTSWSANGVQGFGYGGTNAHAILEDSSRYCRTRDLSDGDNFYNFKASKQNRTEGKKTRIFVLYSHDRRGINRQREALASYLESRRSLGFEAEDEFLQDLAFTLSEKRSRLAWRTHSCASSTDELFRELQKQESDLPASRPAKVPRLGFIFTGQGAQWSRMGVELNQYPVFRKSIEKCDAYLSSSLGCTWSAAKEMCMVDEHSQINSPAFAQPLCTILQIALVDLLDSWDIKASAVVGHSSGEIAAAYCLGALTREDALKAAYYRGLLAARMKELAPSTKGAMLAVGASESEAQNWIDELANLSGEVTIACINSPTSVTLSGDASAIDEVQHELKQKGVFARKLKVETAYHSPHMNVVSMIYLESLNTVQPKPSHDSCRMYSAVTGCAVESSELGAMNWVRNLVSPVLFYDALQEMLHSGNVDFLLEIGPHSALQGPVGETIAKHNIQNISYQPMLIRGRNAVDTISSAIATTFAQGYPVKLIDFNSCGHGKQRVLTNLPSYAWNHSRTFWAESRFSKEYRFRKSPRLSLLGAPFPKMTGSAHIWKGQIRIAEQPWIQDHKIQSAILYPAAGYLAMAIEAAAQTATEGHPIQEFRLKEVRIVAPAVMSEDSDLECIIETRPRRIGSRDVRSTWSEFSISSCHRGEELRENCFGLLQVLYKGDESDSMSYEAEHQRSATKEAYNKSDRMCDIEEDPKAFYDELASVGLNYGPTFQNMTHCRRSPRHSFFTITMLDPELSAGLGPAERTHVIHPTNLDAMFHAMFAAWKGVHGHLKTAMVPTAIEEVVISADIPYTSGSQSKGFCKASEHGFRELMADLVMFDESLLHPTVTVKGFHCSEVSGAGANATEDMSQANTNMFSMAIWKPAIEMLKPHQLLEMIKTQRPNIDTLHQIEICDMQTSEYILGALEHTEIDAIPNTKLHELYAWMKQHQNTKLSPPKNGIQTQECFELTLLNTLGKNIASILSGVVDVEEVLRGMDLMDRWQSELLGLNECFDNLAKYVELLAHEEPGLSILEIGGSEGGAAPYIKPVNHESRSPSRYVFSRPTESEVEEARERLEPLTAQVEFTALSIDERQSETFDVIICTSLEPLLNLNQFLAKTRQLLKPEGKICMTDITNTSLSLAFILRCLNASNGGRFLVEKPDLEGILRQHSLSRVISIPDFDSQHLNMMVVSPEMHLQNGIHEREIVILEPAEPSHLMDELATQLSSNLAMDTISSKRLRWGQDFEVPTNAECICLVELEESLLQGIRQEDFPKLQQLVSRPSKLLWITRANAPSGALAVGLARSIRNEDAGKELRTLSVQEESIVDTDRLAQSIAQLAASKTQDSEFKMDDGVLHTCRVVQDIRLDKRVSQTLAESRDRVEHIPLDHAVNAQKLAVRHLGTLDSLCLEEDDLALLDLGDDEVEIEVKATGLNFRDVMVALGQIPDRLLGFDASGVIIRVGKGAGQFKIGDRVCTLGRGAHRTQFRNKAAFCQLIPDGLTFYEAATLPLVHCTAFHALMNVARVQHGGTILIHAAAGGVGQAALQLAKYVGLEIFATAGSPEKRAMLHEKYGIPIDHILNSRDLSFSSGVLRLTGGRGVDYVLNSLSGQALQETWRCIAPFGTFVEIGLRDIMDNSGLEMGSFARDATFSFLNITNVLTKRPNLMKSIMDGTFDLFRKGVCHPLDPVTAFPISAIEDAFRFMQTGRHSGKIAITWAGSDVVPMLLKSKSSAMLSSNATYVLVGGLGGLGQSLAGLLVRLGARNLCFISRSGMKSTAAGQLIEQLGADGVTTEVHSCDVSNEDELAKTLQNCSRTMPPIKGVIQGAMVLHDVSFATMSHSQWTESLRPKVQGTWNLHQQLPSNIDFFITLSSFAGVFGNRTQSNYAAAGAFQDALAHYRRSRGLKAVTIDLGIMRDVGVIAQQGVTGSLKEWEKPFGIREEEFHLMMTNIIQAEIHSETQQSDNPPQIMTGFATGGAVQLAGINSPFYFSDPRFSHLALTGLSTASNSSRATDTSSPSDPNYLADFKALATQDREAACNRLTAALMARVAKSLQTDVAEISDTKPLHSYGVDSLVAIEIATWLFREVKLTVTVFEVSAGIPIKDFAMKLVDNARVGK
ncbi:hypothetical protein ACLMJK_002849 [Lecanora helva]